MSDDPPKVDYSAMDSAKLIEACGDDARAWAQAFMQINTKNEIAVDESVMRKWFANAIEAACTKRVGKLNDEIRACNGDIDYLHAEMAKLKQKLGERDEHH